MIGIYELTMDVKPIPTPACSSDHIGRKFGDTITLSGNMLNLYWQMRPFGVEYFPALLVNPFIV